MLAPSDDIGGPILGLGKAEDILSSGKAEYHRGVRRHKDLSVIDRRKGPVHRLDSKRVDPILRLLDEVDALELWKIGQEGQRQHP
jgi:hypothetical protein